MAGFNYAEEMRPWTAAAGNIGQEMLALPVLRAKLARERQQDAEASQLRQAQIANYAAETGSRQAQTRKTDAETERLARVGAATERMGKNFPVLLKAFQTGDFSDPLANATMGDMAIVTGENKDDLAALVRSLASSGVVSRAGTQATPEEVRFAGALNNPTSVANNEADNIAAMQRSVAANATREKIAAQRAAGGEYETVTEHFPEVAATPGTPARAAKTHWFRADEPAVPATPGTAYQPKRTVTTRRRIGETATGGTDMDDETQEEMLPAAGETPNIEPRTPNPEMPGTNAPAVTGTDFAQAMLNEANAAIAKGAPRDKVIARLKQHGINVKL